MNSLAKIKLYNEAVIGLKNVENLFGGQVLQKALVDLSKDDENFFCMICNEIQGIMQQIFDRAQTVQVTEMQQEVTNCLMCQDKMMIIDCILRKAHMKLHEDK